MRVNEMNHTFVIFELSTLTLLRPNSDLIQTSHCNIKGLSVSEVMRTESTLKFNTIDILTASPRFFCKKCIERQEENL